ERGVVAFEQGEIESTVFDRAAIDEEVLIVAVGARDARRTDEAPEVEVRGTRGEGRGREGLDVGVFGRVEFGGEINWQEFLFGAVEGAEAFAQSAQAGWSVFCGLHRG